MTNQEIIDVNYRQAVQGIKNEWFEKETEDWFFYVEQLPPNLKYTYGVVVMNNQVYNGGFHQYFVNAYGQFAKMTIDGLLAIGASKKANLVKQALELVNKENYNDEIFRQKLLKKDLDILFKKDDLYDPLEDLDDQYYALEEQEDIEQLLADYLRH